MTVIPFSNQAAPRFTECQRERLNATRALVTSAGACEPEFMQFDGEEAFYVCWPAAWVGNFKIVNSQSRKIFLSCREDGFVIFDVDNQGVWRNQLETEHFDIAFRCFCLKTIGNIL